MGFIKVQWDADTEVQVSHVLFFGQFAHSSIVVQLRTSSKENIALK